MDQEAVGNIVLLAIVTLISVVQNGKGGPSLGVCLVSQCLRVRLTHLYVCVCIYVYIFFLSVFVSLFDCTGMRGLLCELGVFLLPIFLLL